MASNPISSIGVGSGLPLGDLLTQLRTNENTALKLIQTQQISAQNKLSAYGKIKSALGGLQSAAQALNKIGRASCRERVCQYVSISVVAVSFKKKSKSNINKKKQK